MLWQHLHLRVHRRNLGVLPLLTRGRLAAVTRVTFLSWLMTREEAGRVVEVVEEQGSVEELTIRGNHLAGIPKELVVSALPKLRSIHILTTGGR